MADGWVFASGYVLMWQMKFSDDKCKIECAGKRNCNHALTLIGPNCTIIPHGRALGAAAESSQEQQHGSQLKEKKANKILGTGRKKIRKQKLDSCCTRAVSGHILHAEQVGHSTSGGCR